MLYSALIYLCVLLCFTQNFAAAVKELIPNGDFVPMIKILKKFLNFMSLTVCFSLKKKNNNKNYDAISLLPSNTSDTVISGLAPDNVKLKKTLKMEGRLMLTAEFFSFMEGEAEMQ